MQATGSLRRSRLPMRAMLRFDYLNAPASATRRGNAISAESTDFHNDGIRALQSRMGASLGNPPPDQRHVVLETPHDVTAQRPELVRTVLD